MRSMIRSTFLVGWWLALLMGPAEAGSVTFTDGDFSTGWVYDSILVDDPRIVAPGPGTSTGSIARVASGGNPDAHHEHVHGITVGEAILTVVLNTDPGATYDPSTAGAIASVGLSLDLLEDPAVAGSSGIYMVLEQAGQLFYNPFSVINNPSWTTLTVPGLQAADFDTNELNGLPEAVLDGIQPDFSAGGSPLRFGYALGNTASFGSGTVTHRADNWSVTVNPVPEPAATVLLALGAVASVLRRRAIARPRA